MTWVPGETLLIRLWETCAERGIGSLFRPWQMRREGLVGIDLRRRELLTIANAEKQAEEIRAGRAQLLETGEVRALPAPASLSTTEVDLVANSEPINPELLIRLASSVAVGETIRKECNIARAIVHAQRELEEDAAKPPDEKVSDDWLYRWRDNAASVSTEELQNLWGRVLAGEVKSPGTYSLRCLDFLRNLSRDEAVSIEKLSTYSCDQMIVKLDDNWFGERGLTFQFWMDMEVLGILTGSGPFGLNSKLSSSGSDRFQHAIISHDKVLLIDHADPAKTLELPAFIVTPLGREVLRLGSRRGNDEYLRKVGELIKAKDFNVRLAVLQSVTPSGRGTEIRFLDAIEL